jgi:hypothetical protein
MPYCPTCKGHFKCSLTYKTCADDQLCLCGCCYLKMRYDDNEDWVNSFVLRVLDACKPYECDGCTDSKFNALIVALRL